MKKIPKDSFTKIDSSKKNGYISGENLLEILELKKEEFGFLQRQKEIKKSSASGLFDVEDLTNKLNLKNPNSSFTSGKNDSLRNSVHSKR